MNRRTDAGVTKRTRDELLVNLGRAAGMAEVAALFVPFFVRSLPPNWTGGMSPEDCAKGFQENWQRQREFFEREIQKALANKEL